MSAPRVLVIYKRTTFQRFRGGKSTRIQALLDQGHRSVASLLEAHEAHLATLERTKEVLKHLGVDARFRHSYTPEPDDAWDLVVTLGGDGTLLWASHLVGPETPMLAINSAPRTSVGYFCAGDSGQVGELIEAALAGDMRATKLSRMQVSVDGELVHTRVLNDVLFCHECPAATTRYLLKRGDLEESQMSSGLWAGPAAGSTAAVRSAGGRVLPIGSQKLQFVVRALPPRRRPPPTAEGRAGRRRGADAGQPHPRRPALLRWRQPRAGRGHRLRGHVLALARDAALARPAWHPPPAVDGRRPRHIWLTLAAPPRAILARCAPGS